MQSRQIKRWKVYSSLSLLATIIVNFLANYLPIAGKTTGELSALYPNLFVPAGITFSIWGLIYLSLIILTLYFLFRSNNGTVGSDLFWSKVGPYFTLANLLNICWIMAWHYQIVGLSVLIMILLLSSLVGVYTRLHGILRSKQQFSRNLHLIPFSLYLGWICVALIANMAAFMVSINWSGFGLSPVIWTVIVIAIGTLISLRLMRRYGDVVLSAVTIWALVGIMIKRQAMVESEGNAIVLTLWICIGLLSLVILYTMVKKPAIR